MTTIGTRTCLAWAAAVLALALIAGTVWATPHPPVIGPTSWSDALDDGAGLSWLENTQQLHGQVNLNPMQPLSSAIGSIRSLAEGPEGAFYLGTSGAHLWRYDPANGVTTDLGAPVPAECDN